MKTDEKVVLFLWLWRVGWLFCLGAGNGWVKLLAAIFLASSWKDGPK